MKSPPPLLSTRKGRFNALDAQRGLIMVLMALDHASYFIARTHSVEFWAVPLPSYPDAFWFWTRWVTHLCAPGFFLLMGIGMVLFAVSRQKAGWSENRITNYFVIRGLFLILLQILVENRAWAIGALFMEPGAMTTRGGVPGSGSGGGIYFGVLFALGGAMVVWAFLRRCPSTVIAFISIGAILLTQWLIPDRGHVSFAYSPLSRILLVPGYTKGWIVFYPLIPWLGPAGLGLLFGRLLHGEPLSVPKVASWAGAGCLIFFILVRSIGTFGNLNDVPPGWMGFLNVVKYPPSLSFLAITLAVNFMLMAIFTRHASSLQSRFQPLLVFGRTPLFFYLLHLYLFALLGILFPNGSSLGTMYLVWLFGLAILYPLCYQYARFKSRRPVTSLWRFL